MRQFGGYLGASLIAAALALSCLIVFVRADAGASRDRIEALGQHTVGSKLSEVRGLRRSESCYIEGDFADCRFKDSNGVAYVVFEDTVIAVVASDPVATLRVPTPFGLQFGESVEQAVAKLTANGGTWILGKDPAIETRILMSSRDSYPGENGWSFTVEVLFENGRLVEISFNAGPVV